MSRSEPSNEVTAAPIPQEASVLTDKASNVSASKGAVIGWIFLAILAAVFVRPLMALAIHAAGSSLHSHILLIPLISIYLLRINRETLPKAGRPSLIIASVLGCMGLAFYLAALRGGFTSTENDYLALMAASFLCFLWGGGFFFLGRQWMAAAAFPAAFLIFIVPLPDAVVEWLETASKFASAEAAAWFLAVTNIPYLRDGLFFRLPGITIEVAQECSGIRSSWVLFITSLLASHLFLRRNWRRAVLVALVIPLGILRNGFRIAVISWLCVEYGPQMIDSPIHHKGGPIFFALSLVPLFVLLWWLRRGEQVPSKSGA